MDYQQPLKSGFTIYSKSGCINCNKVKDLLRGKNLLFSVIVCDEYILEDKDNFLLFIKEKANKEIKTFPIDFYDDIFIGGYTDTLEFINNLLLSVEENLNF